MKEWIKRLFSDWRDDQGNVLVMVGLMLTVLLGLGALVTDVGVGYWNRRMLQNAVDGAALAGARELPTSTDEAHAKALDYAAYNGASPSEISISFGCTFQSGSMCPDTITVEASRTLPPLLRAAIGLGDWDVATRAVAITTALQPRGIVPWGIGAGTPLEGSVTLKNGAHGSEQGNFHAVAFPNGRGSNIYGQNIRYGYNGPIIPNDPSQPISPTNPWMIESEPGVMAGDTISNTQARIDLDPTGSCTNDLSCPRVIIVPLLKEAWSTINGRKPLTVIGFAAFFLEGVSCSKTNGGGNCGNGHAIVTGHFLDYVTGVGGAACYSCSLDSTGVRGVFLWQ